MNLKFPDGFWWGSATSAPQSEGKSLSHGKSASIWDYWFEKQPNRFHDGIGCKDASSFYDNWKSDIALLKELKHNSFRTSISWSRLIPDETGNVNPEAVEFYNNIINELIESGIEPFVNLFHFDMPLYLQEKGGWESREVVDAFAKYAETCFLLFGDRVTKWFTFNEPIVPVEAGYLYDNHYPNVVDFKRAVKVAFNSMVAHAKAVKNYKSLKLSGKVGIILNLTPSYPKSSHYDDINAANLADLLFNRSFLDPCVIGEYPCKLVDFISENGLTPPILDGDIDLIKENTIDFLGINYYQPRRIKAKLVSNNESENLMPESFFDYYVMPDRKVNPHRGWEIYEKGIYDLLGNIRKNYGNIPCYISENGMGVADENRFSRNGVIDDQYRIDFVKEHLKWVHQAILEGSNCKGYHMWTFIDCWSWCNSYKNRYGFVQLDLTTNKRIIKSSGRWFAEVSKSNSLEA